MDEPALIDTDEFIVFLEGERLGTVHAENRFHAYDLAIRQFNLTDYEIVKLEVKILKV